MDKVNFFSPYFITKLLMLACLAGLTMLGLSALVDYNDIRGVDSNVVYTLQQVMEDNSLLYTAVMQPPYNITQYSPLYYILCDGVLTMLGIDTTDYYTIRIIIRVVSFLALLITLYSLRSMFRNSLNIPRETANILCALFFAITFPWYYMGRPDVFVMLFLVLSINTIISPKLKANPWKQGVLLGLFIALGVASKLTMAFYGLPFALYLLVTRNWKLILGSGLSFFVSLGLFYGIATVLNYDLTYIRENILKSVDNGIAIGRAFEYFYSYYVAHFGVFSIGLILLCVEILRRWKDEKNDSTLIFLLILNLIIVPISLLMPLKPGSAENYFNEQLLCMILLAIYILEKHYQSHRQLYTIFLMAFGIMMALSHAIRYRELTVKFLQPSTFFRQDQVHDTQEVATLRNFLKENLGLSYFYSDNRDLSLAFPKQCTMFPLDIHENTYVRNIYDYSLFQKWVTMDRKLKYLVVSTYRKSLYGVPIEDFYNLKENYPNYMLYELKPDTESAVPKQ